MPPIAAAIAALGAIAIGSTTVGAIVTTALVGGIVSTGLGLAASAILGRKKPPAFGSISGLAREIIDNKVGTVEYIPVVYGRHRVGGIVVYKDVANSYLYQATVLCEGEIEEVETVYIDGVNATDSKFSGLVDQFILTGADDQVVPEGWLSLNPPGWDENFRCRGTAVILHRFKKNTDVFPQIPVVTAIVKGRKVYDTRDASTGYSVNPSLCLRDYLLSDRFGMGLTVADIDEQSFIDGANTCETTVDYGNGNQDKYTLNTVIQTGSPVQDNIDDLLKCCNGILTYINGRFRLVILKAETATFTFDESNILKGGFEVQRSGKRFKKNQITSQFIDPNQDWTIDFYIEESAEFKAEDNDLDLPLEIELPGVIDRFQASYLSKIALRQSRLDTRVNFPADFSALEVEIGDVVEVTHSVMGWSARLFRVMGLVLNPDATVTVSVEEYDEDVYSIETVTSSQLGPGSSFQSPFIISAPVAVTLQQTFSYTTAGDIQNNAVVRWQPPLSGYVDRYQVEYKLTADSTWIVTPDIRDLTVTLRDLAAGVYDIRVKARNTFGVWSEPTAKQVEIKNSTDSPADVTGFNVKSTNDGHVVLSWNENSDVFAGGRYVIKHFQAVADADWNDVATFILPVSGKEKSCTVPALNGTYMVKGENLATVQSDTAATFILDLPESIEWETVNTITEAPDFGGTLTDMVVVDGILKLDGSGDFDDAEGDFDDGDGDFDSGGGSGNLTEGSYEFETVEDHGAVYRLRITGGFTATFTDSVNSFDVREGLFDAQPGLFDGEVKNSTTVKQYYATTRDDPGGSPTWSDWAELTVNDVVARGVKRKIVVTTDFSYQNVEFSALGGLAKVKVRPERGSGQVVPTDGVNVTFPTAFYSAPVFIGESTEPGDVVVVNTVSRTAANVQVKDAGDNFVERTIRWYAIGPGEEIS